ncbi:MAG: hypothetical protein AB2L14_31730 [Candidatus Xenobiia bacterium LiM19]
MKKKILFFSRDPGSANVIIPVVKTLMQESNYDLRVIGKDMAIEKFRYYGILITPAEKYFSNYSDEEIHEMLLSEKPDAVVTGASGDDLTERKLWRAATETCIPSLCILDQWTNYRMRFSRYKLSERISFLKDQKIEYLPKRICIMDDFAMKEAISEGISEELLCITGHPYIDFLCERAKSVTLNRILKTKNSLTAKGKSILVVYVSEPIPQDFPENYRGYNEKSIFSYLYNALEDLSDTLKKHITLVIRIHPRENKTNYDQVTTSNNKVSVRVDSDSEPLFLMLSADLICGMSSMFLIEAAALEKKIMSIQIGLKTNDPFVLSRKGLTKTIVSYEELIDELRKWMNGEKGSKVKIEFVKNATQNIIKELKRLLCQN